MFNYRGVSYFEPGDTVYTVTYPRDKKYKIHKTKIAVVDICPDQVIRYNVSGEAFTLGTDEVFATEAEAKRYGETHALYWLRRRREWEVARLRSMRRTRDSIQTDLNNKNQEIAALEVELQELRERIDACSKSLGEAR